MARGYAKDQPQGFKNGIERVAIVGAGGRMGKHITEALLNTGKHTVTAIQRADSTSTLPDGVLIRKVNYEAQGSIDELAGALEGQQALIITMSVLAPRDTVKKLIQAAAMARVSYVLPNWFGQDPENETLCQDVSLAALRDDACNEIKRLGVSAFLLLACNFWYEFSLGGGPNRFGFDITKLSFVKFDEGNERINTTTWPQCGRAVAAALSLKELPQDEKDQSVTLSRLANRPIYVSSFLLSQQDMFEAIKQVTGTSDEQWTITTESSEERWRDSQQEVKKGNWSAYTKMLYSRVWFKNGGGDYESTKGLDNKALGLPVEDLHSATERAVHMGLNGEVPYGH